MINSLYIILTLSLLTLSINSWKLNLLFYAPIIQVEHGYTPFLPVLVPICLPSYLLDFIIRHCYLHYPISKFEVFFEVSDGLEELLLIILILSLEILDLDLRGSVPFSQLLYDVSHIIDLILQVLIVFFDK
jgi:hypothetical protein